jgi:type I restriction-modification system DNA methylase subunit
MQGELYCGENGCTLHDYKVSPAFCEYEWHKVRKRREEENNQRRMENVIAETIKALTGQRDVPQRKPAETYSEQSKSDKYKGGGLSI